MDGSEINSEMRLWALEVLVCNLFVMLCALDPQPANLLQRIRAQMIHGAKAMTFPGHDAAMSDHLAAELEAAVTRLMDMGNEQMKKGLGG